MKMREVNMVDAEARIPGTETKEAGKEVGSVIKGPTHISRQQRRACDHEETDTDQPAAEELLK